VERIGTRAGDPVRAGRRDRALLPAGVGGGAGRGRTDPRRWRRQRRPY